MSELITPLPKRHPLPRGTNARYDWASAADGEFHLWRDVQAPEDTVDSRRAYHRLKISAREWAARRGGTSRTRIANNGRQVWIAITLPGGDA